MTTTQHPLTETDAAELWDANGTRALAPWGVLARAFPSNGPARLAILRAAFDLGREYERDHAAQARPADVTTEAIRREVEYAVRTAAAHGYAKGKWGGDRSESIQALIKSVGAALTAALAGAARADPRHDPRPWQDCTEDDVRKGDLVAAKAEDMLFVGVAHHQCADGAWCTEGGMPLTWGDCEYLRRIPALPAEKETPMPETTTPATAEPLARTLLAVPEGYGAPHHDAGRIKAGDFVLQVDEDGFSRAGIAHRQGKDGDWQAEDGRWITWPARRADRPDAVTVWPAPTPPAVEVEWKPQFGDISTDVRYAASGRLDRMVWTGCRWTYRDHSTVPKFVIAATLPDGTRVRRDGERPDGEPRFVKVQEGEK